MRDAGGAAPLGPARSRAYPRRSPGARRGWRGFGTLDAAALCWGAVLPFWISIALLSLAQGVVVALPGVLDPGALQRLSDRRWAAVPAASIVLFVLVARAAEHAS